jgi:hypothetical protein
MSIPVYIRLSDAQTAFKYEFGQDDMRQLRDNQDSFDGRILQILAQSKNAIVDDFLSGDLGDASETSFDDGLYFQLGAAGTSVGMVPSTGAHVQRINSVNSATLRGLAVKSQKMSFRLNQDMAAFLEVRHQDIGAAAPDNLLIGFSDQKSATDETDCIAFLKGSTAGKYRFRVASGGVQTETDNIGNRATWQKLRIELLRSGGGSTLQVRAFIDGAEISGSPFTTHIPTSVAMRLLWAAQCPASGTTDIQIDRWEMRWTAVPVNS